MKNIGILLLFILGLGGCLYSPPGQSMISGDNDIDLGRRYFMRECGRCHGLVYPQELQADQWHKILARKKRKVSLTGEQFELLSQFVLTYAEPEVITKNE